MSTVAIVTCAPLPQLDPDEAKIIAPLARLGITGVPAVWDDPAVDWDGFDLSVIRCPWDYQSQRETFLEWARRVPRLHNAASLVEWNTDKRYLAELSAAGVPIVPTDWWAPGESMNLPESGDWVLKPSVGAGSRDAGKYSLNLATHRDLAAAHLERLHGAGTTVMAQPYLADVDANGERALVYIGGRFSHAIRKSAMLSGPYGADVGLYKEERITAVTATDAEKALAERVLAAAPSDAPPLYARVDVVTHAGELLLLELELTEPSLFYGYAAEAADRMAGAIAATV